MNKQIDELDGLRGWMALWVWFAHVSSLAMLPLDKSHGPGWLLANGEFAVGVFIILSGFVIALTLSAAREQPRRVFYVRRTFRLFPAYLVCLAISAFLLLDLSIAALQALPWESPRTANRLTYLYQSRQAFWTHLTLHVPLLHGLVPQRILPASSFAFIGQAWSLSLEWQFYLVAPFGLAFMRLFDWTPVRQGALLVVLALLAQRVRQIAMLPSHLYLFVIGYFSYLLYERHNKEPVSARRFCLHVALWTAAALWVGNRWLAVLLWAPVLYGMVASSPPRFVSVLQRFLRTKLSARLGAISYSFYCSHMIFVFGCAYVLIVVLELHDKVVYASALIASSLLGTLLFSSVLYAFVEKPSIAFGRRVASALSRKSRGSAVPAA